MSLRQTTLACAAVLTGAILYGAGFEPEEYDPEISVSRETTYVTRPLNRDGSIDFAGAINLHYGKGVTAANNANVLFWQGAGPHPEQATMSPGFFKQMGMTPPPENGRYLLHLHGFLKRKYGNNLPAELRDRIYEQQGLSQTRPWTDAEYPEIAAWLETNAKPLEMYVKGSRRPHYFSPMIVPEKEKKTEGLISVLLPAVQGSRTVARLLTARAMRSLKAGKTEAAWNDLIACQRIGRLVGRGPTLIEGLVGYAIGSIANDATVTFLERAPLTRQQLQRYRREFDALPRAASMAEKFNFCERLVFLDSVTLIAHGGPQSMQRVFGLGGAGGPQPPPLPRADFGKIEWDSILKTGNVWFDRVYAAAAKPDYAARKKTLQTLQAELKRRSAAAANRKKPPRNIQEAGNRLGEALLAMLTPAFVQAQSAEDRFQQRQRNLQTALALAAYRVDNGRYPGNLSQLVPKYLKSVPRDLFTGGPLKYGRSANGYTLYSVGLNERDDHGKTYGDGRGTDDLRIVIPRPREN